MRDGDTGGGHEGDQAGEKPGTKTRGQEGNQTESVYVGDNRR